MSGYYSYGGGRGFFSNIPRITRNLLIVNLIFFIATLVNNDFMIGTFALFSPSSPFFRPWQIVTYMFMHGGWMHIFFNMYALVMFGGLLERVIGERKYLLFYFLCGFGAAGLHFGIAALAQNAFMMNAPTLGASGAVYGLLIAYGLLFPDSKLTLIFPPVTLSAKWWVAIWAGIELLTGVTGTASGVAHFAHLGGMLVGLILILYWKKKGTLFDRKNF